jgi:hypothetical protein
MEEALEEKNKEIAGLSESMEKLKKRDNIKRQSLRG